MRRYDASVVGTTGHVGSTPLFSDGEYEMMSHVICDMLDIRQCPKIHTMLGYVKIVPGNMSFIVDMIDTIARDTRLMEDLPVLFREIGATYAGKLHMRRVSSAYTWILSYAYYCPFEPSWHMRKRGASKRLDDMSWRFIRSIYVNGYDGAPYPQYVRDGMREETGFARVLKDAVRTSKNKTKDYSRTGYDSLGNACDGSFDDAIRNKGTHYSIDGSGSSHDMLDMSGIRSKLNAMDAMLSNRQL